MSINAQPNIPKHWQLKKLGDVLDYVIGGDWGKDTDYKDTNYDLAYCIRGSEIKNWHKEKGRTAALRKIKKSNIAKRKLEEGDILIEISGGGPEQPVGRTVLIDADVMEFEPHLPKICTNFFRLIRPSKLINPKYLNFYLQFFYRSGKIIDFQSGSNNLRNLNFSDYSGIIIPVPPLRLQNIIVTKIEELFTELDKGIEKLKTAQEQLKTYRQAVLKSAFEGNLTEDWRKKNKAIKVDVQIKEIRARGKKANIKIKYGAVNSSIEEKLLPIPKEWIWIRNEELIFYVTSGSRDWKKYYSDKGSCFIRTQNLNEDFLDLSDVAFVDLPKKVEGKRSLVEKGDLLMTITGANVGKVAYVANEIPEAYVSQSVALMKYIDKRMMKYIWYYFQCKDFGQGLISGLVYGMGRPVLNLENMKEVPVAFCSFEEQNQVVQEIENRLSVADKMEESINQSLQQVEALRQSILKKVFEGEFV